MMMISTRGRFSAVMRHPWRFVLQVAMAFRANQGLLLAGAVAYYTLLSIVPMFALILVGLSQFVDKHALLQTTRVYMNLLAPGEAPALMRQITTFLDNWKVVGVVGLVILLFFSSLAFTVLENAMAVIFSHRAAIKRRHFLVSAVLPYLFIVLLALGLFIVSAGSGALQSMDQWSVAVLGHRYSLGGLSATLVYIFGVIGEVLLLTSLYMVMPVGRLALRHALIGGVTATLLWEIMRHVLVWYFSTLSLVNVIYGSFATAVVILLSFEAAAVILLVGAQVIAEYERGARTAKDIHYDAGRLGYTE